MRQPEPGPALCVLASLGESFQFALGLPVEGGRVAVPAQWLKIGACRRRLRSSCWLPRRSGKETCGDEQGTS